MREIGVPELVPALGARPSAFILTSGYPPFQDAMPEASVTRLTISWSKQTDLALRSHLGSQGLKKGALSKFIEDAVQWRLFNQTLDEVHEALAGVPARELESMIGAAVRSVRKDKHREPPGRKRS